MRVTSIRTSKSPLCPKISGEKTYDNDDSNKSKRCILVRIILKYDFTKISQGYGKNTADVIHLYRSLRGTHHIIPVAKLYIKFFCSKIITKFIQRLNIKEIIVNSVSIINIIPS